MQSFIVSATITSVDHVTPVDQTVVRIEKADNE